tara:strand:- start:223 stop:915 length:693 start_codon:yes stop_codon:yes gene_type:complete
MGENIVFIEDDKNIRELFTDFLSGEGYNITALPDGIDFDQNCNIDNIDLFLLDYELPGRNGLDLVLDIRKQSNAPIILLSGNSTDVEKIIGLETGADDYLLKPILPRELVARIKAVMRRYQPAVIPPTSSNDLKFGPWRLNNNQHQVLHDEGHDAGLTATEYDILSILVSSKGRKVSRDQIFQNLDKLESDSYDRSIDILIGRIRKKLGDDPKDPSYIKTIRGVGYLFIG